MSLKKFKDMEIGKVDSHSSIEHMRMRILKAADDMDKMFPDGEAKNKFFDKLEEAMIIIKDTNW